MKYSIIIPTFNKVELLKECLYSVILHTDLTDTEVIVVSNGCNDDTVNYMNTFLDKRFRMIHWPEPIGYPNAVNVGISVSKGDYIILLNNDLTLLSNQWLPMLIEPFNKFSASGVTGPVKDFYNKKPWVLFFCAAIKKEVFKKVGLLDISFSPGIGEDVDFCMKAHNAGFTIHQVPEQLLQSAEGNEKFKIGAFPVYHKGGWRGGATFGDPGFNQDYTTINADLLKSRYGEQY